MLLCKEKRDTFIWSLYVALTWNAILAHDMWLWFTTIVVVIVEQLAKQWHEYEELKAAYQQSLSQKSTLRIDKQVAEKKCEQKEREIKSLESTIKELKEDNRNLK